MSARRATGATALLLLCALAPAAQATGLDELLAATQAERAAAAALAAQRMAAYDAASAADQERLLADALAARAAAEVTSRQLLATYGEKELQIGTLNQTLKEQLAGNGLGEIFGLARQAANDAVAVFAQSLLTAELAARGGAAERDAFLRRLASGRETPVVGDLERLWLELQREMTAGGRVTRYQARVVQADGTAGDASVVNVGPFTAVSGRDYLSFQPELAALIRYPRQPPAELRDAAEHLQAATSGYTRAVVDPTRGVLLAMYVERPSWLERVKKGEEIGYVIIAVGVLGLVLWLLQFVYLLVVRTAVWMQLRNIGKPSPRNPLGRVLLAFKGDLARLEDDAEIAELRISEAVLREVPRLERFQAFLRLAVAAGPLLGLIGTVVGMIITFQAITESGSSDPKLMADGIGQAMIATVLGLGIAIPLLFANAMLTTLSRAVVQILDEQSAGLLAASLEQRRRA